MGGDKDFTRWLRDYDNRRLDPDGGSSGSGSKLNWHSSKYDLESMNWQEVQSIYLPEIENCWGPACNYLRKLWFKYKMQKRQGEKSWDVILDISRILYAMGLPLVEFDNGPDIEWIKAQLDMENRTGEGKVEQTSEDVEAKYEEDQEKRSLGYGNSDGDPEEEPEEDLDSDISPDERELYRTLRREERDDARERRTANVNMILEQLGVTPREEETDYTPKEGEETDEY
jgi:hypothetical protein